MNLLIQQLKKLLLVVIASSFITGCNGSSDTPSTFFEGIREAASNNDPSAVWDTIPSSMQNDIDSIAQDYGNRLPEKFYDSAWTLVRRLSSLLENKREFIMNTPVLQMGFLQATEEEKAQFIAAYDYIVPAINKLGSSQIGSVNGLKTFNTSKFIAINGSQLMDAVISLAHVVASQDQDASAGLQVWQSLSSLQVTTVSENGDNAIVETSIDLPLLFTQRGVDGTEKVTMKKVDGKWIPLDLHLGFKAAIAEAKANLATTDFSIGGKEMMGMSMIAAMADVALGPLEASSTQAEFDNAIQQLSNMF